MGFWKKQLESGNRRVPVKHNFEPVILTNKDFGVNPAEHNAVIEQWVPKVRRALRSSARWFADGKDGFVMKPGRGEKKLAQSIGSYTKKDNFTIEMIAFKFERHGVFIHKGVGRGYNARGNGFVIRTAKGSMESPRTAVEWFNPILERHIPELANKLAEVNTNAAVNATRMKIN